ncbi:cupin domain-containing protein [Yeosuana sp.]|uniref:cupin domain-containing protein n=1 Tax=Yeosuana sp. TaxID=2529388 RepID=UPI004054AD06|tara:strand:+ start:469 stop:780 length:312 start_codon:yes stop_codon:yes gene_type:complete
MTISDIEQKEVFKGFKGRFIHMESFTLGFWEIESGSEIPMHSHVHEQTTEVIEGQFEMTCNGITKIYEPGMIVTIPSNVLHGGRALTHCKLSDVFCPVREDYK